MEVEGRSGGNVQRVGATPGCYRLALPCTESCSNWGDRTAPEGWKCDPGKPAQQQECVTWAGLGLQGGGGQGILCVPPARSKGRPWASSAERKGKDHKQVPRRVYVWSSPRAFPGRPGKPGVKRCRIPHPGKGVEDRQRKEGCLSRSASVVVIRAASRPLSRQNKVYSIASTESTPLALASAPPHDG